MYIDIYIYIYICVCVCVCVCACIYIPIYIHVSNLEEFLHGLQYIGLLFLNALFHTTLK